MLEHIDEALSPPFFLSLDTPLPDSRNEARNFATSAPESEVLRFWDTQLSRMYPMEQDAISSDTECDLLIPDELKPAAGKLRLAPLMSLMYEHNLGGTAWLDQFIFGFKLTRALSQQRAFPPSDHMLKKKPKPLHIIAQSDADRFKERAAKSGYKNAESHRQESLDQQEKGWHTEAPPRTSDGAPFATHDAKINVAVRFGVEQADKLRACDDLRYSMTNLACCVAAPIKLASWGHLAEMCRADSAHSRVWHFFKADREAAYQQAPPPLNGDRVHWK